MMLCTATLLPPSWVAMLPQKFSAATTCNFPDDEPPAEPAAAPPQAEIRTAQHTTSGTTRNGTRTTTVPPAITRLARRDDHHITGMRFSLVPSSFEPPTLRHPWSGSRLQSGSSRRQIAASTRSIQHGVVAHASRYCSASGRSIASATPPSPQRAGRGRPGRRPQPRRRRLTCAPVFSEKLDGLCAVGARGGPRFPGLSPALPSCARNQQVSPATIFDCGDVGVRLVGWRATGGRR